MEFNLATKLIEKNLINSSTEVTVRYRGGSMSGDMQVWSTGVFTVVDIMSIEADYVLIKVYSTRDGAVRIIRCKQIIEIDGMEPNRFASVYDIKADGGNATVAKRRGRKPKDRSLPAPSTTLRITQA